jgi:chromosome segregation ATPase
MDDDEAAESPKPCQQETPPKPMAVSAGEAHSKCRQFENKYNTAWRRYEKALGSFEIARQRIAELEGQVAREREEADTLWERVEQRKLHMHGVEQQLDEAREVRKQMDATEAKAKPPAAASTKPDADTEAIWNDLASVVQATLQAAAAGEAKQGQQKQILEAIQVAVQKATSLAQGPSAAQNGIHPWDAELHSDGDFTDDEDMGGPAASNPEQRQSKVPRAADATSVADKPPSG